MKSWERFAKFFGRFYTVFVVVVAHSSFLLICLTAAWTSPVLSKLGDLKDNPLGRTITDEESDRIGSLFFIGAALGPLIFINIVDKFGRKKVLVTISALLPLSYFTLAFAANVQLYYICRILLGVYAGVALSIEPVYISEVLSDEEREFFMSLLSSFNFTGILSAVVLGPFVPLVYFNSLIGTFSSIIMILLALGCPESPYHLMQVEGKDETKRVLSILRSRNVNEEIQLIEDKINNEVKTSYLEIFSSKQNFKMFIMATIPLILQQLSGITLIVTYSQLIFEETNLSIPSQYCSIIVVILQVSTTFLTPLLLKSRKFSQRSLLLLCLSGLTFCNLLSCFYFSYGKNISHLYWMPLIDLLLFVLFYNCGLDPIPWMLLGEIYPMNLNAVGTALSTSMYLLSVFPILYSFRKVEVSYLFLCSALSCFLGLFYVKIVFNKLKKASSVIVQDCYVKD